jgi:integrase
MEKPRLKYQDVFVKAKVNPFPEYTVAWLMEKYVNEMNGWGGRPPVKPLGETSYYKFRQLQGMPIGAIDAAKLTKEDVKVHCRSRINDDKVLPATVMHDITALTVVLKHAPSEWDDCEKRGISFTPIELAKPSLQKHGYIGKSTPRTRVPTDEEIEKLVGFFSAPKRKAASNEITAMPDMIAFALMSSRRVGEICRIRRSDINWANVDKDGNRAPLYMVRDMKDPKKKVGNHGTFPLFPELEAIILRQPEKEDRIFPYRAKSVSAKYTRAKRELGIVGLRFHDSRRQAITAALAKGLSPHQVRHYYSGHKTTVMLERVYDATKPDGGFAAVRDAA